MAQYSITEEIRKKYPEESKRWEELLRNAGNPEYRGCYTCKFYREIDEPGIGHFADIESVDEEVDDKWFPWDGEEAWVYCSLEPNIETPLRTKCPYWKLSNNGTTT